MPRQVRIEYPGAIYHVMSRGDRREDIYHDEESQRPGEVGIGGTFTPGNDTDDERDCPAAVPGQLEECHHPAAQPEKEARATGRTVIVIV